MHADYIANPLYDNNPFIEALPPILSGKDLIHALAVIPPPIAIVTVTAVPGSVYSCYPLSMSFTSPYP